MGLEEIEITRLIFERLKSEKCLDEEGRETVAYRIAEIMVAAKEMYTKALPRLTNVNGESNSTMEEDLTGLQMTFTHLCDLMHEYDAAYLQAMKLPPPKKGEELASLDGQKLED